MRPCGRSGRKGVEPAILLDAARISKSFDGFTAVDGAGLRVETGEIVGIIGPNGAGKSTFFNCLTGDEQPSAGSVTFDGVDVTRLSPEEHARLGMARTHQVPVTFEDMTILDNVMVGAFLRHPRRRDALAAATEVLRFTGLGEVGHLRAGTLGTPGRKRLEIARALATGPRLLLLDEALAGLTPAEIRRALALVRDIHTSGVTLVIVEHLMEVIFTLARRVIVFNYGAIIATGTPEEIVNNPRVVQAYLGTRAAHRPPG